MKSYIREVDVVESEIVWELATTIGCLDADRCNGHTRPCGSCQSCLDSARRTINELSHKGIEIRKKSMKTAAQALLDFIATHSIDKAIAEVINSNNKEDIAEHLGTFIEILEAINQMDTQ